jgi:ABC-type transport system involved in cytochrome bd biosynthesis fused ATPase/permease subunit
VFRLSPALAVRVAAVAAASAAAVCVSACGPVHEGAAATVGGTRISVAALDSAVAKATATPTADAPADRTGTVQSSLTALIQGDLIADGAKQKGVTVSEADIQSFLQTQRQTNGTDAATAQANGIALADLHQAVYEALLLNKLIAIVGAGQTDQTAQQQALTNYLGKVATTEGVSVNPRYGAWNAAEFDVVPSDPFTSSSPAPSAPAS